MRLVIKSYNAEWVVNNTADCGKEHLSTYCCGKKWMTVNVCAHVYLSVCVRFACDLYDSLVCTLQPIPKLNNLSQV